MTPDHTPYLVEGDLRTPQDVLEWLARPRCCETLEGHIWRLRERLDRERRQACRRAALLEWRRVCELVRWCDAYRNSDAAWHEVAPSMWRALTLALAFRAAAREP